MNESIEVTLDQVDACLALFKAVREVIVNAVGERSEQCVEADVWGIMLDAYADVAEQWDW